MGVVLPGWTGSGPRSSGERIDVDLPSEAAAGTDVGKVVDTLVLSNNTEIAGNYRPLTGGEPISVAYDPIDRDLFVLNYLPGTVSVVNTSTDSVVHTVYLGPLLSNLPQNITFDPVTGDAYVTTNSVSGNGSVLAINGTTDRVTATIPFPPSNVPSGAAYDSKNRDLYVSLANTTPTFWTYSLAVISPASDRIVGFVPEAGGYEAAIAFDPANGDLYVLDSTNNVVEVVRGSTNQLIENISVNCGAEDGGGAIGYDPANHDVYAVSYQNDEVCVLDTANNSVIATVPLPLPSNGLNYADLSSIGVDPAKDLVYIPDGSANQVAVVNGSTNEVVGSIPSGSGPSAAAYDAHASKLFVANAGSSNLTVWNPAKNSTAPSVTLGVLPTVASVDPATGTIFLGAEASSNFLVINASITSIVGRTTLPGGVLDSVYDPGSGRLYVLQENPLTLNGTLLGVNPSTLSTKSIAELGSEPQAVALDTANGDLYVSNFGSDNVSVVSGASGRTISSIPLPPCCSQASLPAGIAYDPVTGFVYVDAYTNGGALYEIHPAARAIKGNATLDFFAEPGEVSVDPVNGDLYVTGQPNGGPFPSGVLGVVSGKNLTQFATIPVGAGPGIAAYDPLTGDLYVPCEFSNNVTVVHLATNRVVANLSVGNLPGDVVYDSVTRELYVFNLGSGTVSVISTSTQAPPKYSVDLHETGLPSGTEWWVNLTNGQSFRSTKAAIKISEANGSYAYSVGAATPGYAAKGGSITVYGANLTVTVRFSGTASPALSRGTGPERAGRSEPYLERSREPSALP